MNCPLQHLAVGWNNIGDNGIIAIAEVLKYSNIVILDIRSCGITFTGAGSLAEALSVSKTIKELLIWYNAITVEGARLIMQSAVDNEVCHYVMLNDEYDCDDEVARMKAILESRKNKNVSKNEVAR